VAAFETKLVVVQEIVLCKKGRDLVEDDSFKCFSNEWKKGYRSVGLLSSGVTQAFLNAVGKVSV